MLDTEKQELLEYASKRTNSELIEDVTHLTDLDIIANALGSTEGNYNKKLPLTSLNTMAKGFSVYRDEFLSRLSNSDTAIDTNYQLLKYYFECVKITRALSKYISRYEVTSDIDFTKHYSRLAENKGESVFSTSILED